MIISDLNHLEIVEDTNIEGAGYADFTETFSLLVNAQRLAVSNVLQQISVTADAYKTITFLKQVTARAEV